MLLRLDQLSCRYHTKHEFRYRRYFAKTLRNLKSGKRLAENPNRDAYCFSFSCWPHSLQTLELWYEYYAVGLDLKTRIISRQTKRHYETCASLPESMKDMMNMYTHLKNTGNKIRLTTSLYNSHPHNSMIVKSTRTWENTRKRSGPIP